MQLTVAGGDEGAVGEAMELLPGTMLTRLGGEGGKMPARGLDDVSACHSRG